MSASIHAQDPGVIRAVHIVPRPVIVALHGPHSAFVALAVEEYFTGTTRMGVKILCSDDVEMCVAPSYVSDQGDLSNVVILNARRRP
jgi:hypothetical protein